MDEIRRVYDPDGREVVFDFESWLHLAEGKHPWTLDHLDSILATVVLPYYREDDPTAGRERFYARHLLLQSRWLRVIVDYAEDPARVVTAFVLRNDPRRGWR